MLSRKLTSIATLWSDALHQANVQRLQREQQEVTARKLIERNIELQSRLNVVCGRARDAILRKQLLKDMVEHKMCPIPESYLRHRSSSASDVKSLLVDVSAVKLVLDKDIASTSSAKDATTSRINERMRSDSAIDVGGARDDGNYRGSYSLSRPSSSSSSSSSSS